MNNLREIADRIKRAKSVAIFTHMRPDGDAFGSALSLSAVLTKMRICNQVCVETEIPSNLAFVNGIEKTQKTPRGEYDLLVTVDCADLQRLGALSDEFLRAKRKKIDSQSFTQYFSVESRVIFHVANCR